MNQDFVVKVENVFKSFKTVKAVNGLSFDIKAGQFLALLGPNGAGKTTMVEMIEGIQIPDSGQIYIGGKDWKHHGNEIHQFIGISLQETRFIDKLTVRETLQVFAGLYGLDKKRVDEVIDIVSLEEKQKAYVVNLSGGQRQRLALGISIINNPKLLLLDEPTTGLDPNARREVWHILQKMRNESNISLLLTTHYMEEAEQLCDTIIILDHGQILQQGTLDKLIEANGGKEIIEITFKETISGDFPVQDIEAYHIDWDQTAQKAVIKLNDVNTGLKRFFATIEQKNLNVATFISRKTTLDDLFISLTGRHLNE
jgi:ABC-2 type transport system ATP-binding protein